MNEFKNVSEIQPELKPCPFCGAEAKLFKTGRIYFYYTVRCPDCKVLTTPRGGNPGIEKSVTTWNSRARGTENEKT